MAVPTTPFRGIDPFRYLDHNIFFAREEETYRLTSLVSVYRGVMLYGDSGAGKSSLINAGLLPEAIRLGFQPERLRVQPRVGGELVVQRITGADPEPRHLPSVLAPQDGTEETLSRGVLSIGEFEQCVRAVSEHHRLLLIFDQFEEIVTLFDEAGAADLQRRLVDLIVGLLRGPLPVKILLSFRDDYLGKVKELLSQCPELVDQALRLVPPAADALPTIIRGPFERYPGHFGRELSPALAGELVSALAERFGSGDVSLSEVQTVCLRLWQSDNPEMLLAEKGPQGLLEDFLGEALASLPQQLRPAAIALLGQMVTSAGTRNVISAGDLFQRVREQESEMSPSLLEDALHRLSQSRLVRRERRRDLYLYEITSEFLVPWISRRRAELRRAQERRKERRRFLILASIAAALLIVAAGVALLAVWALRQRNHARNEATAATSLVLASDAQANRNRLEVALLLSLASLEPYHASPLAPVEARSTVTAALESARRSGVQGIIHGYSAPPDSVAFSPDGRTLAAASYDRTVRLWDVATHKQVGSPLTGPRAAVYSVVFSPDGRTLASASGDGTVRLWGVATHKQLGSPLTGPRGAVHSVAFSPDGRRLASGSRDGTVRLWDVARHKLLGSLSTGHNAAVYSVAFSPDGRTLASASGDAVRLWDVATHKQLGPPLLAPYVNCVAFSPNGHALATATFEGSVKLWDTATHMQRGSALAGRTGNAVLGVAFSPDGRTLATANGDNTVTLWSVTTHKRRRPPLTGQTGAVSSVAFSPDGRTLAAASYDNTIRLWDLDAQPQFVVPLTGNPAWAVFELRFSYDGRTLVTHSSTDRGADAVTLWDVSTHKRLGSLVDTRICFEICVVLSPDGRTVAFAANSSATRFTLWNVATHRQLWSLEADDDMDFSPNGRSLASANRDGTVQLWDVARHRQLGPPLADVQGRLSRVQFSPDGRTLATVNLHGMVTLWDVGTHRQLGSLRAGPGFGLPFAPDGRTLAVPSSKGNTVRLWDVVTHMSLGSLPTGDVANSNIQFSSDGRVLAIADNDGNTLRLWNVGTHKQVGSLFGVPGAGSFEYFLLSPDGRTVAADGGHDTVGLWDIATQGQLISLPTAPGQCCSAQFVFSPDGRILATSTGGNVVTLWSGFLWRSFAELKNMVCNFVGTGLSQTEWTRYAPGVDYKDSCK